MSQASIPAQFWRGGTSKALVFRECDLPTDPAARDAIFLGAMGSPDDNGRQLNGMGGGMSSLSKVCILGPSSHPDADVDYTFVQVPVGAGAVDYSSNCGNMSSAMGPAALDLGMVPPPQGNEAVVRIHNTNTGKVIVARFPADGGRFDPRGDFRIDGVSGSGSAVRLEFLAPGGAKTGRLLPTGRAVDMLTLADGTNCAASCIDAANPCVFVDAATLGKTGLELPDALEGDAAFLHRIEQIRQAASVAMGLTPDLGAAAAGQSLPKVAMVSAAADGAVLSGALLAAADHSIAIRMMSMGRPHRAVPVTGAICLAVAARLPGTIPAMIAGATPGALVVGHPSGTLTVDADVTSDTDKVTARSGTVYRTARKLFAGEVWHC
ncbi:2-methylaconitate cis-trans isomerase PrpF family protein [Paracoccus laeviglucosivorans]|uniref:PrpF family protein n=1 Tax=Paracoccus laeviglucosivorans TaxID=1197861 RepID=A0A521FL23_9RHOB|nr:PrpF domain-containing protein [Paracoccus laeviglucosivorans]SMO96809.1 hypothetical protein SAMN06265221_12529 [Paracoccus laeviglucosivorans]